jgi:hypothetical protein
MQIAKVSAPNASVARPRAAIIAIGSIAFAALSIWAGSAQAATSELTLTRGERGERGLALQCVGASAFTAVG